MIEKNVGTVAAVATLVYDSAGTTLDLNVTLAGVELDLGTGPPVVLSNPSLVASIRSNGNVGLRLDGKVAIDDDLSFSGGIGLTANPVTSAAPNVTFDLELDP